MPFIAGIIYSRFSRTVKPRVDLVLSVLLTSKAVSVGVINHVMWVSTDERLAYASVVNLKGGVVLCLVEFVDHTFDLIKFHLLVFSVKKFHVNCITVHYMLCYD